MWSIKRRTCCIYKPIQFLGLEKSTSILEQQYSHTNLLNLFRNLLPYKHITYINMSGQGISHQGITAPGLSEADQNINNTTEDISNKASGYKANLSNPSKFIQYPPFASSISRGSEDIGQIRTGKSANAYGRYKRRVKEEVRRGAQGAGW